MSDKRSLLNATATNNEDKVYNILRRTPIQDMAPIFHERFWEFYSDTPTYLNWLAEHGWELEDFKEVGSKYEKSHGR